MKWHDEPELPNGIQVSTLRDEKNLLVILTRYHGGFKIDDRKTDARFELCIGEHSVITYRTCFDSMDRMKKIAEVLAHWDL